MVLMAKEENEMQTFKNFCRNRKKWKIAAGLLATGILIMGILMIALPSIFRKEEEKDRAEQDTMHDAAYAVADMQIGWNLGNALDSYGNWIAGETPVSYETAWGNPVTTKTLIRKIKEAGFRAVRVPVTWYPHVDEEGRIDEAWLERVREIVDYVLEEDMYCIINVHHDTGAGEEVWIKAEKSCYEENKELYASIWRQIAEEFAGYGEKLLFEGYNEMLDGDGTWTSPETEEAYEVVNKWAQLFVDTVRETGGNNSQRNLIINTYSADAGEAAKHLVMPADTVENHLIAEVHIYAPQNFTSEGSWITNPTDIWTEEGKKAIAESFAVLDTCFLQKGIPVIVGEFGAKNKQNEEERAKYAAYFAEIAGEYGIAAFWWDDGSTESMGIMDRNREEWSYPLIQEGLTEKIENVGT